MKIFNWKTSRHRILRAVVCPNAFSVLVIILLAVNYFAPFADLDFTWHIRTGQQIVETKTLRPVESFTYTIAGQQVPDFEWLYEVAVWAVWTQFGFGGLKLCKVLLVAATLVLLGMRLSKERVQWPGIGAALLAAILVLSPAWNLRPLYCTTIGVLLVSGWLRDHCRGRQPLDWRLPMTMLLWANCHPGVIAGQGLLAGAMVWESINGRLHINRPLSAMGLGRLCVVGSAGLVATLISPDPLGRLLYPFQSELRHPIWRIFAEMQPLYFFLFRAPLVAWVVYPVALVAAITVVCRFRRYRVWEIALLVALFGLANAAVRSLQDWLLVTLALTVPQAGVLVRSLRKRANATAPTSPTQYVVCGLFRIHSSWVGVMSSRLLVFQWVWPLAALMVLGVISLTPTLGWHMPIHDADVWPRPALDWIERHRLQGRFFAPPDYGSYLGWRLGATSKSYVDTRGFFFPPELIEDSHYIPQLTPDWRSRLERVLQYGTDYCLFETSGVRGRLWQALRARVGEPLYLDDQTVLLSADQLKRALLEAEKRPETNRLAAGPR
jgi:hypothetical protein